MKKRLLSISLKLTLIVGIFISSILKVDAQSFLISFPNNPQDVTACYSSELHTVRLDAIVDSTTGGDVVITLPNGVEYVPTSVAMISGSSGISISENGGTLNAPIFKINPGTLNIADYIIFLKQQEQITDINKLISIYFEQIVDGMDYEFTLVFDIDINHFASSSKDRTGLFSNVPDFKISSETGKNILDWCNSGADNTLEEARAKIKKCEDMGELKQVYNAYIEWKDQLMDDFTKQKREILSTPELTNPENFSLNGSK